MQINIFKHTKHENRFENDFEMKILKSLINVAVNFKLIKKLSIKSLVSCLDK